MEDQDINIVGTYDYAIFGNGDELSNTNDNNIWIRNKNFIEQNLAQVNMTQNIIYYGQNLILFYENKINALNELIKRKSVDGKKNFVGDITIQNEQRMNIRKMLMNDDNLKQLSPEQIDKIISDYEEQIGAKSSEIMEKDYNERNMTIKYLLLKTEYEENVKKIKQVIGNGESNLNISSTTINDEPDSIDDFLSKALIGGKKSNINISDVDMNVINSLFGGENVSKNVSNVAKGGVSKDNDNLYKKLEFELVRYNTLLNNPLIENELLAYYIIFLDNLQMLSAFPHLFNKLDFLTDCNNLKNQIKYIQNSLKSDNIYGGKRSKIVNKQQGGSAPKYDIFKILNSLRLTTQPGSIDDNLLLIISYRLYRDFIESEPDKTRDFFDYLNKDTIDSTSNSPLEYFIEKMKQLYSKNSVVLDFLKNYNDKKYLIQQITNTLNKDPDLKDYPESKDVFESKDVSELLGLYYKLLTVRRRSYNVFILYNNETSNFETQEKNSASEIQIMKDTQSTSNPFNFGVSDDERAKVDENIKIWNDLVNTPQTSVIEIIPKPPENNVSASVEPPRPPPENNVSRQVSVVTPVNIIEEEEEETPFSNIERNLKNEGIDPILELINKQVEAAEKIMNDLPSGLSPELETQKGELQKDAETKIKEIIAESEDVLNRYAENMNELSDELNASKERINEFGTNVDNISSKIQTEKVDITNIKSENKIIMGDDYVKCSNIKDVFDNDIFKSNKSVHMTPHSKFVYSNIQKNYLKYSLYKFIEQCSKLDSLPQWRAKISTLIVTYMTNYMADPNDPTKHITIIPSYEYFNIVLTGTPGVGKSYTSSIVGKVLQACGLLTVGNMREVKKPDIVGSYTGQTAPKVYYELTQGLGNVIFIDEAYSIAGVKDKTKGTYNDFGQECLDAITDYTSEHIGLFSMVVAGYDYEMRTQFLEVNVGLPRRFPSVFVLRRYDMKALWLILQSYIKTIIPKKHLPHNHASFELLNIMFNFQSLPNPQLELSKDWSKWWAGYILKSINANLYFHDKAIVPILKLPQFDAKLKKIVTGNDVEILPLMKLITKNVDDLTKTFVKASFMYIFCNILNGDFFRSQADNLTKFGQTILQDKITNPKNYFDQGSEVYKYGIYGNEKWTEYLYFKLYFSENPNKKVNNINYQYTKPGELPSPSTTGGSRLQNHTRKHLNLKMKKNTRRVIYKSNKQTRNARHRDNHKRTKTHRNINIGGTKEEEERRRQIEEERKKMKGIEKKMQNMWPTVQIDNQVVENSNQEKQNELLKENLSEAKEIQEKQNKNWKLLKENLPKAKEIQEKQNENWKLLKENLPKAKEIQERQNENWKLLKENLPKAKEIQETQNFLKENPYEETEPITNILRKEKRELGQEQYRRYAQGMILDNKNYIDPKTTEKDLVFTISTSISIINNIEDIIDNIIKEKKEINKEKFDEDSAKEENAKLNQLFNGFKEIYNNTKDDIQNKIDNPDSTLDKNDQGKFEYIIYVYILLSCYRIAIVESRKQIAKSDVDSWWFFTAADFSNILKDLNIENIINNFINEIQTLNPAAVPSNDDNNDDHSVNEEVDVRELRINKFGTEDQIKEYYREKELMAINKLREEGKLLLEEQKKKE